MVYGLDATKTPYEEGRERSMCGDRITHGTWCAQLRQARDEMGYLCRGCVRAGQEAAAGRGHRRARGRPMAVEHTPHLADDIRAMTSRLSDAAAM